MASLFSISFIRHHSRNRSSLWITEALQDLRPFEYLRIEEVERHMILRSGPPACRKTIPADAAQPVASAGNDQRGSG